MSDDIIAPERVTQVDQQQMHLPAPDMRDTTADAAESPTQTAEAPWRPEHNKFHFVPFERYASADAINATGLKAILRSPAHYWYEKFVGEDKDTPALRFGQLVHAAMLEPDRFEKHLSVGPEGKATTKEGKAARDAWQASLGPDSIAVTAKENEALQGVIAAVRGHKVVRRLLAAGKREASVLWQDSTYDVACKARYDFVAEKSGIIVDIKTTLDARHESFSRDLVKYQYGLSAAHYLQGAKETGLADCKRFVLVVVEKTPPFGIMLYELAPEEIQRSRLWWYHAMRIYAECRRNQFWPCYSEDFNMLEAPAWAPPGPGVPADGS